MKFRINRVYDIYNLSISIEENQNIVILIGPNGSGKTTLLRMFEYALNLKHFLLFEIDFDIIDIEINDSHIRIQKPDNYNNDVLKYYIDDVFIGDYKKIAVKDFTSIIRRYSNLRLIQTSDYSFIDERSNIELSIEEVIDSLPDIYKNKILENTTLMPESVKNLLKGFNVHFVTSDRLETKKDINKNEYYRDYDRQTFKTIEYFSSDLKNRISTVLSNYADNSRKIDKDFPHKILSKIRNNSDISKEKLGQIIKETERVSNIIYSSGLLMDNDPSLGNLKLITDDNISNIVINQYMEDTINKLTSLLRFSEKMNLFKNLINSKLSRKRLFINKNDGFYVKNESDILIELKNLSSGEQQQIILFYDLLFQSNENQIYLIDEPEISLHVEWQRSFLSDITKIIGFSKIKVIIATHSPQIIGDNWDITTNFGERYVEQH